MAFLPFFFDYNDTRLALSFYGVNLVFVASCIPLVKKKNLGCWSIGDRCTAPYEDLLYPAVIRRVDTSAGPAEVCFDFYENVETVALADLYPEEDYVEDGESDNTIVAAQEPIVASTSRKRGNGRASRRSMGGSGGAPSDHGSFRAPIPSLAPPPPPSFAGLPRPSEDDALSSMLMSWYMSGYHTGYYQAMQDLRGNK